MSNIKWDKWELKWQKQRKQTKQHSILDKPKSSNSALLVRPIAKFIFVFVRMQSWLFPPSGIFLVENKTNMNFHRNCQVFLKHYHEYSDYASCSASCTTTNDITSTSFWCRISFHIYRIWVIGKCPKAYSECFILK